MSEQQLEWLRQQLERAEISLKSRLEMANQKPLTQDEIDHLIANGAVLVQGKKLSKAKQAALKEKRAQETLIHQRIAVKISHDVDMLQSIIATIENSHP